MSAEYKAIYKCRLCGMVYANGLTTGEEMAYRCTCNVAAGIVGVYAQEPLKLTPHLCEGDYTGSVGLADFQGWRKEGQE